MNVVAQSGGYNAVGGGENNSTEIQVNHPDAYVGQRRYVYMKNAKGEYDIHEFTGDTETTMVIKNHEYRIKKMNMIEVFAFQSQITFKGIASTEALYNAMFERCEVNICEK